MVDDLSNWFDECAEGARLHVHGRLHGYRCLALFREHLVESGVERAHEVAKYLQRYNVQLGTSRGHYFANKNAFNRWLMIASYRETLRLVLDVESVEVVLLEMVEKERFNLRMRYIDQFTDDDVARILELKTPRPPFFDAGEARRGSHRAYVSLCERLEKRFPANEDASGQTAPSFFSVFPYYPGANLY